MKVQHVSELVRETSPNCLKPYRERVIVKVKTTKSEKKQNKSLCRM